MDVNYTIVTELPKAKAPKEQLERLYQRYRFASQFCEGKDVLEVACGGGMGLGYLAKKAKKVVGGDIDEKILEIAKDTYKGRDNIEIHRLDAENLSFEDNSFDVILLYEAIYYLAQPERFIKEAKRVLRKGGKLIICTVNKDWSDFNPSPFSIKYFSAPELYSLLSQEFSSIELYGAFSVAKVGIKDMIISTIKRIAVFLHLIPRTMKGKEFFKRLFWGKLTSLPSEIKEGMAEYCEPVPIFCEVPNSKYKVLFAIACVAREIEC